MDKYKIHCTPEQTKKALELYAPIEAQQYIGGQLCENWFADKDKCYKIPTAEEMIGWLEDQGIQISIIFNYQVNPKRWNYDLDNNKIILFEHNSIGYSTCKEATLAAINAALNFLICVKQINT